MIAPTRITPWIAFAPDISGVCSVVDTFETTSKPMKTARTKNVSSVTPDIRPSPQSATQPATQPATRPVAH